MFVPRCPTCSFALVLLERRLKYKCSKCGKLFFQKEIDDKTFRQWNVKQRELDFHNLKLEKRIRKEKPRLSPEERRLRKVESSRRWRANNREIINERNRARYCLIKDKINLKRRKRYTRKKEHYQIVKKTYRYKQLDKTRQLARIHWWRKKQRELAQQEFRINDQKPYPRDLDDSFSTFGLANRLLLSRLVSGK